MKVKEFIKIDELEDDIIQIRGQLCIKGTDENTDFNEVMGIATKDIKKGSILNVDNIWVKKPGTGEISAEKLNSIVGRTARDDIKQGQQLSWAMIND